MSRYSVCFYKSGYIRYISHLDLLRLFKRSFKRVGIKLKYSQGFNPHPKMSFAQPLSLGYTSSSEYLEFETIDTYPTETIVNKLNSSMPEGLGILSCEELPASGKSLAAMTETADYEIIIPAKNVLNQDISGLIDKYISQNEIMVFKRQKKGGKDIEINIKPLIFDIEGEANENQILITAKLAAGSSSNLSPELVLASFCNFAEIQYDRAQVSIKRTAIHFNN
ncbi:MAG: TIGR03936 family radical SAM-associated protein [Eubacteriales bacterium]|nr:TIGR03936 family radical SAM-associated protein [Eubacteriales bacterium]MDD3199559.1 TIGR03936 family radical SAM-associated protein [Eubacteriales bacterium]MDD4122098.1 TIGR03936 family radical SAM-associated protein [Eubacteriales bacterium]MDD4629834.1 TIGR03936 family radical SAM-associated protein [Eubacteriales bacterium]